MEKLYKTSVNTSKVIRNIITDWLCLILLGFGALQQDFCYREVKQSRCAVGSSILHFARHVCLELFGPQFRLSYSDVNRPCAPHVQTGLKSYTNPLNSSPLSSLRFIPLFIAVTLQKIHTHLFLKPRACSAP